MVKRFLDQVDREVIDGKPYFGLWFGSYFHIHGDAFVGDINTNPIYQMAYCKCNSIPDRLLRGEEIRYKQIIVKPPMYAGAFNSFGTMGVKYVIWGRAFRVMKHIAKGVPRYKKLRRGGKLKWVKLTG